MKKLFLSLTALFAMASCVHGPTMVEDVDELDSIESMLLMVDDDAVPIPTVTVNYAGDSTRTRRSVNTRGKPSFRVVIHRLKRYVRNNPLSDVELHEAVVKSLARAQADLVVMWEYRKECRTSGVTVEQCKRKLRPIVKRTRQLLNRIIMAVRSDRRNRGGR